jgi:Na+-driven multidrug efflux pump
VVAGSNPAVPTFVGSLPRGQRTHERLKKVLETLYLLLGIIGFFALIAAFFFGGFVILDFLWSRRGGDS